MRKTLLTLLALLLLGAAAAALSWRGSVAATASTAQADIALRIHGSNTVGESLMPSLVTAFLESQGYALIRTEVGASPVEKTIHARVHPSKPDLRIEIHAHGSTTAFEDLDAGSADLGMSSRRIKAEEVEKLKERFGDLTDPKQEHVIALDALAIIVPPQHPLEKLTVEQIARIFAGDIRDWAELGFAAGPISLYSRDDNSGTYDTFKELVLKKFDKKLRSDARRFESSEALTDAVLADPNGIGFVGVAYAARAKLIAVSADGVKAFTRPAKHNIGTESYALSRRLYVYEPANHGHALLSDFLRFAGSDAGQRLVDAIGLISYYPTRDKPRIALQPFPALYQSLGTLGERLSVNFVSENAQLVLDSKTERDLARVANFFRDHPDKRLVLAEFTASRLPVGSSAAVQQLEQKLADHSLSPYERVTVDHGPDSFDGMVGQIEIWAL